MSVKTVSSQADAANPLGYEKEGKLLVGFAIPCIISMLVTALYNIVEQIFIGQGVGLLGNAATNIAFPLSIACTAIALLLGIGSATNFSLQLGAGNEKRSAEYAGNGLCLMALFGTVLMTVTLLFLTPMLKFFGATPDVLPYAEAYTRITALGFPFLIMNTGMSKLILADGSPRYSMMSMLIGALINTVLDPLFIFGLGMGTAGAGLATALSQTISFCILLSMFLRGKTVSQFCIHSVTREAREFGMILIGGAPSFGRQGLNSIGGMLLNIAARSYGDAAVAGMSIVSRIFMFIISVVIGVGQGLQPVAAFNYGARKFRRVRQAAIFTMGAAFCMLVVLVALCWVDSDALIRLFRDDPDVTAVALPAFRFQCLAILLQPVIVVANMLFQSVGKAGRATFLACCRQGVFFIPLILILPRTLGLVGVETCQPIADMFTFIVSLPFLLAFLNQLSRMDDAEKARSAS